MNLWRPNTDHQATRSEMLAWLKTVDDPMAANVAAVLEQYPLVQMAAEAVGVVERDLRDRGGFRELIMGDAILWQEIKAHLVSRVAEKVVYRDPVREEKEQDLALDFSAPDALDLDFDASDLDLDFE